MNTEECLKKIERYLLRSDVGVLVVDVQNSADLSDIVSHFNVTAVSYTHLRRRRCDTES